MRLLLDEQFPLDFVGALFGHEILHVHTLGWTGIKNGELMRRARNACDVFVTLDRSLPFQQNVKALTFAVIVVAAVSNRMSDLLPHVSGILNAAGKARPREAVVVGA